MTDLQAMFLELDWIESLGYDTVIQYAHANSGFEGGHVFHITKPSGHSVIHVKAAGKYAAIKEGIAKFKKQFPPL
jgi:hypothetical protein